MIKLNNIKKHYVTSGVVTKALDGIDLEIEDGEMLAIMGSSGAGKSTLLNIIGCMDNMTDGTYIYNNQVVSDMSLNQRKKFCKEHISFIFQDFALMDDYTVYENIELPLLLKGVKRKERKKQILEYMEKLGIIKLLKKYPKQLSGGEKQRTAIARAIIAGNDIILADEPTGALDSDNSKNIMELLKEINSQGKTVIIVTHDEQVTKYAKKVFYIKDGREYRP